jgi:GMP synthase (glutamine-hydrolysing)
MAQRTGLHDVLIVKLGSAPEALRARRGDFEHWFARGLGISMNRCLVINPMIGEPLPDADAFRGAILTGSEAMLTDNPDWSRRTQDWLERILARDTPILGVCYGHQLLTQTLDGKVGWSPQGEEIGTVTVELTAQGRRDPLLASLPEQLMVQSSHSQSVLQLPPGARLLAYNSHDPVQGFAWGSNSWGVQFHPEFDADISRTYIEDDREKLEAEKRDPDALLRAASDADYGGILLRNFADRLRC